MKRLKRLSHYLWQKRVYLFLFSVLFAIFFSNTLHEEYPDEYDSLLGGRYIAEGKAPYRDWFQHHQPGAYTLASFIYRISGQSFVQYRYGLSVAWFLIGLTNFFVLKRQLKDISSWWYVAFLFVWAASATYFWSHMLLADSLAGILIVTPFALLSAKTLHNKHLTYSDIGIISLYSFLTWYTSMTSTFLIAGITAFTIYKWSREHSGKLKTKFKSLLIVMSIILLPYLMFFGKLLITNALDEWIFANITYNSRYYIYNYPRPYGSPINPVRYAVVIAYSFITKYFPALSGISGLQFWDPLVSTMTLSGGLLMLYSLIKKIPSLALLTFILLVYSNARSSPDSLKQTDYQALTYVLLSTAAGLLLMSHLFDTLRKHTTYNHIKIIQHLFLILLGSYWVFTSLFFTQKYVEKMYPKYMGTMPLIYDRPEVAPLLNTVLTKSDYAWIGPFEFKELFYMNAKVPTRFHWFLDHAKAAKPISEGLINDFEKNTAKIIVFRRDYAPWGGDASTFNKFFTDYLDTYYIRLFEYNKTNPDVHYEWTLAPTEHYNFDGTFNFRKEYFNELVETFIKAGAVKKVNVTSTIN